MAPLSPAALHRHLLRLQAERNQTHWRFLEALLLVDEGRIYRALGYSSTRQYAEKHFGLHRSALFEALRVARTLRTLPEIRQAFRRGFAYVRTREITRIATVETEGKWLAFANEVSLFQLKVEVADALATGRKEPRDKASVYGLPAATRCGFPSTSRPRSTRSWTRR